MREYHDFKIHAPMNLHEAYVEMDGKRLNGVTSVVIEAFVGKPTKITLGILGNVVADADVGAEFGSVDD